MIVAGRWMRHCDHVRLSLRFRRARPKRRCRCISHFASPGRAGALICCPTFETDDDVAPACRGAHQSNVAFVCWVAAAKSPLTVMPFAVLSSQLPRRWCAAVANDLIRFRRRPPSPSPPSAEDGGVHHPIWLPPPPFKHSASQRGNDEL